MLLVTSLQTRRWIIPKGWPEKEKEWDRWKGVVDEFLATVQFRKEMLEEVRR